MKNKFSFGLNSLMLKASILGSVLFLFSVTSNSALADDHALFLCRKEKAVRTLRVEKLGPDKCRSLYSKSGLEQVIGSNTRMEACMEYVEGVRETLVAAAWNCKQVKVSTQNDIHGDQ